MMLLCGKGSAPAVNGKARAAANDTTPRIPDHATTVTTETLTSGSAVLIFLLSLGKYAPGYTQIMRPIITAALTIAPYFNNIRNECCSMLSRICGSCNP